MRHIAFLLLKYLLTCLVLTLVLARTGATTPAACLQLAALVTLSGYAAADRLILAVLGHAAATTTDAVLAFAVLWAAPPLLGAPGLPFAPVAASVAILALLEHSFHRLLAATPPTPQRLLRAPSLEAAVRESAPRRREPLPPTGRP